MNARRIMNLARALDCKQPEIRVRYNDYTSDETYRWTVAVLTLNQVSGPSFAQESANLSSVAEEHLIRQLEKKLDTLAREHEEIAAKARRALQPDGDE